MKGAARYKLLNNLNTVQWFTLLTLFILVFTIELLKY